MAALAERREIGVDVVGGVVVAMCRGQHDPGPAHGPEDIYSAGRDAHAPSAPVAPGCGLRIPPSAVAEVDHGSPMRSATALAASPGSAEPDQRRELRPVDRVEEAVLAPDGHCGVGNQGRSVTVEREGAPAQRAARAGRAKPRPIWLGAMRPRPSGETRVAFVKSSDVRPSAHGCGRATTRADSGSV